MSFADIESARTHCASLRDLILYSSGGWADYSSLDKIVALCASAAAIEDDECREQLRLVRRYAGDMFSDHAHRKWDRGNLHGAYLLKLHILRALDALARRLSELETLRLAAKEERPTPSPWKSS
jgi:hypothetical protein